MRKFRLSRLVLAATVIGVASLFSLPAVLGAAAADGASENHSAISHVDWTNADETYPLPPGTPTPSPSYDGDGTSDPDSTSGDGDGQGPDPSNGGASPESGPRDSGGNGSGGGLLDLGFPVQAGMSVGLLALAFLALLPGRKMPADLR